MAGLPGGGLCARLPDGGRLARSQKTRVAGALPERGRQGDHYWRGVAEGGETGQVRLEVAKIAANGGIRRWVVDTATRSDAGRWDELAARVPAVPPPYRAAPGSAVYDIRVDDDKFLVGEHDLAGPLSDLVRAVLVEGDAY
jgi:hypothetical protein